MNYLNYFLPAMEHLGMFGYWLVLLVSLLESLAFVGIIIPGSLLVIAAGFISAHGYFDVGDLIWFAATGAIFGDGISYYLGTKGTRFFRNENKILKLSHLDKGKSFFKKHGNKSVFFGRFVGPVRPIIPFVAGLSKMDKKSFIFWNVVSAFLWAAANLFLGYFFGGAAKSVEAWSTRAGAFILFLFLFLFFIWLIIKKSDHFFSFLKSVFLSIKEAIADNKDVRELVKKHLIFFGFIKQRTSIKNFSGLPLTLLIIAFVYIVLMLFGVAKNVITSGPIIAVDERIKNLLYAFRDFELVKIFTWITALAKGRIIISFAVTASFILWLWRKNIYVIPMWITVAGSAIFSFIGKIAFHRNRPDVAVYVENTFSFPSGHSTMAVAFFGFIIYILLRHSKKWEYKINILFVGLVLILSIGLSRLYLGVHFLSDVWGGYLLGLLWLFIGIAVSEWLILRFKPLSHFPSRRTKIISCALLAIELAFYVNFAFNYNPIVNKQIEPFGTVAIHTVSNILGLNNLPRFTETIIGEKQEPISVIIMAKNDQEFVNGMMSAGWHLADNVDISSVARLAKSAVLKKDYPNAPMTPSFWNSKVNDFGFEKETSAKNIHERHHSRFWRTQFETADGDRVYVGNVSFDAGIKWLIVHKIKPDIDTEREFLFADLQKTGLVLNYEKEQSVEPTLGKNFSGDQFFTDGKLYSIIFETDSE